MEKRIFLAIVISLAILLGWASLAPKLFPELVKKPQPQKPVATNTVTTTSGTTPSATTTSSAPAQTTTATSTPTVAAAPPAAPIAGARVQTSVYDTPEYRAVFTNRGAQLTSFTLKSYDQKKQRKVPVDLVKARGAARWDYPFVIVTSDAALTKRINSALYAVSERDDRGARVIEYRYSDGRVVVTKSFRF
ncbi:MAG TPA: membrane protein insertase YidC, partial [Thermoanaerobaculia bacterium]|nr:membrane protein insertase YidC [Thermoanaerobaculia bacterium]